MTISRSAHERKYCWRWNVEGTIVSACFRLMANVIGLSFNVLDGIRWIGDRPHFDIARRFGRQQNGEIVCRLVLFDGYVSGRHIDQFRVLNAECDVRVRWCWATEMKPETTIIFSIVYNPLRRLYHSRQSHGKGSFFIEQKCDIVRRYW